MVWVETDLKDHLVPLQLPWTGMPLLDQITPCSSQPGFECFQKCDIHSLCGQPVCVSPSSECWGIHQVQVSQFASCSARCRLRRLSSLCSLVGAQDRITKGTRMGGPTRTPGDTTGAKDLEKEQVLHLAGPRGCKSPKIPLLGVPPQKHQLELFLCHCSVNKWLYGPTY